jgi:hypothetical protein
MPRNLYRIILGSVAVLTYVWACRELYLFMETDFCIDHGGAIDPNTLNCDGARHGYTQFFGQAAPLVAWIVLFALPTVPAVIATTAGTVALYWWRPSPSNSTPHADARASSVLDQSPSARAGGRGR